MKPRLAIPLLAALAITACAQLVQAAWTPPAHDAATAPSGTYHVEPTHTQVLFSVLHMGFTHYYGVFSGASGTLSFNPANPARMAVAITLPVASIQTTSDKLTGELKSPDWLDAAKYPAMIFRSVTITRTGAQSADIAGLLTLHGVTKPLTLHASFIGDGVNILDGHETLGFQATGMVDRAAFGVARYVPLISSQVQLTVEAAFEKS